VVSVPRLRTVIFLVMVIASVAKVISDFTSLTHWYLMPTPDLRTYDIAFTGMPVGAGLSTYYSTAQSPHGVEAESILSGNVTLCCVDHPSYGTYGSSYMPLLFILTSDQMISWKDHGRDPREYVAATSINPPLSNYSYSGVQGTEPFSFRIVANAPGVHYFVVSTPIYEKGSIHLRVLGPNAEESLWVEAIFMLLAISGVIGFVLEHRSNDG
jgi:hypothetical protein